MRCQPLVYVQLWVAFSQMFRKAMASSIAD